VPRLFLHELLPDEVKQVLVLDTDILVMADVIGLWEWFAERSNDHAEAVLGYAPENQNIYRIMYSSAAGGPEASGHNSGVFLHRLDRMRAQPAYHDILT